MLSLQCEIHDVTSRHQLLQFTGLLRADGLTCVPHLLLSMQDGHSLIHSMACLSVAGREPGFDKTNQDYVVVHPGPADSNDECEPFVFGVLDGHGVEGILSCKLHHPIIITTIPESNSNK